MPNHLTPEELSKEMGLSASRSSVSACRRASRSTRGRSTDTVRRTASGSRRLTDHPAPLDQRVAPRRPPAAAFFVPVLLFAFDRPAGFFSLRLVDALAKRLHEVDDRGLLLGGSGRLISWPSSFASSICLRSCRYSLSSPWGRSRPPGCRSPAAPARARRPSPRCRPRPPRPPPASGRPRPRTASPARARRRGGGSARNAPARAGRSGRRRPCRSPERGAAGRRAALRRRRRRRQVVRPVEEDGSIWSSGTKLVISIARESSYWAIASRSASSTKTNSPFETSQPFTSSSLPTSRSCTGHQRFCLIGVPHSRCRVRKLTSTAAPQASSPGPIPPGC